MKQPAAVYVEFGDHCSAAGWAYVDDLDPAALPLKALGFIVKETETMLVISSCINAPDLRSAGRQYIIKSCISKRVKVKLP